MPEKVDEVYNAIASENKKMVEFDCAHIEGSIDYPQKYIDAILDN